MPSSPNAREIKADALGPGNHLGMKEERRCILTKMLYSKQTNKTKLKSERTLIYGRTEKK